MESSGFTSFELVYRQLPATPIDHLDGIHCISTDLDFVFDIVS